MATTFRDKRNRCYICGNSIKNNEAVFVVQRGEVFREYGDLDEKYIDVRKNPSAKFIVHASCQNELLWKQYYPNFELEHEYYAYLSLGWKDNKIIWRLGNYILKDSFTQTDINKAITALAKKLLKGN